MIEIVAQSEAMREVLRTSFVDDGIARRDAVMAESTILVDVSQFS